MSTFWKTGEDVAKEVASPSSEEILLSPEAAESILHELAGT